MKTTLSQLILRYLIFIGIPFVICKRLEKLMYKNLSSEIKAQLNKEVKCSEEDVQKFPDVENISENCKDALNKRGGSDPVTLWFAKIFVVDFAVKAAIAGAIGSTIWSNTADNAAGVLAKYSSVMLSAPGKKFAKLVNKLRRVDNIDKKYQDVKELLLDKNLSVSDKLDLLKIKLEITLKELKGVKRTKFILFVIAALLFFFGGGKLIPSGTCSIFTALMERLRALLQDDTDEAVRKALIEVYLEYNAPLPQELIPQPIKDAINGIE